MTRRRNGSGRAVAMIHADERNRMLVGRQLRVQFNPPCGVY